MQRFTAPFQPNTQPKIMKKPYENISGDKRSKCVLRIPVANRPGKVIRPGKGKGTYRRPGREKQITE